MLSRVKNHCNKLRRDVEATLIGENPTFIFGKQEQAKSLLH